MLFSPVFAQAPQEWSVGVGNCAVEQEGTKVATIQGFECVFRNIVSVAVTLAGLAIFVMLIVGGFKYLTSGGDPKAQEQAKNTMTYAVFGLVLIIAAYLILNFVATFTGVGDALKTFTIPR